MRTLPGNLVFIQITCTKLQLNQKEKKKNMQSRWGCGPIHGYRSSLPSTTDREVRCWAPRCQPASLGSAGIL